MDPLFGRAWETSTKCPRKRRWEVDPGRGRRSCQGELVLRITSMGPYYERLILTPHVPTVYHLQGGGHRTGPAESDRRHNTTRGVPGCFAMGP